MRLICLNTWSGKLFAPLISYIKEQAPTTDIFCFQEVYSAPQGYEGAFPDRLNLYEELTTALPTFQSVFAPSIEGFEWRGRKFIKEFPLLWGLATFVKSSLYVSECSDFPIYRSKGAKIDSDNYATMPRNLLYTKIRTDKAPILISNVHGLWFDGEKTDTADTIAQSRIIKEFNDSVSLPRILCGDFNLWPNTKSIGMLENNMSNLIKEFNISSTRPLSFHFPVKYADYTFVSSGVRPLDFKVPEIEVSDHLPLILDFDVAQS